MCQQHSLQCPTTGLWLWLCGTGRLRGAGADFSGWNHPGLELWSNIRWLLLRAPVCTVGSSVCSSTLLIMMRPTRHCGVLRRLSRGKNCMRENIRHGNQAPMVQWYHPCLWTPCSRAPLLVLKMHEFYFQITLAQGTYSFHRENFMGNVNIWKKELRQIYAMRRIASPVRSVDALLLYQGF